MNDEVIQILRGCPLFGDLDDASLEHIAQMLTDFEVPAGRVLVEHGQPGSGMFFIVDGTVSVELPAGPVELGHGEFFGELALLAEITRVARVRATTMVRGLALGRAAFADLLEREPRLAVAMLPVLARRLAQAESA